MDTWEDVKHFTPGRFVLITGKAGAVSGVIASMSAADRTITFTDGRTVHVEAPVMEPASEPEKEAVDG